MQPLGMTKAYSYIRFSSKKQERGDSVRRQTEATRNYAKTHGLTLDESITYEDLGLSAFHGLNAETGALSAFLDGIKDGTIEKNSFLLIESIDRLSRQGVRQTITLINSIVDYDITIVTLSDLKVYTATILDDDPLAIFTIIITAMRAADESREKSRRVKAAWTSRKKRAVEDGYVVKELFPKWLDRDGQLIPDRVAVIQRMVSEYLNGSGMKNIALRLNSDGIPCFGNGKSWWDNGVRRILTNPAIAGQYEGREGYFAAAVTEDQWSDLSSLRSTVRKPKSGKTVAHPLAGIARCCLCGGLMTRKVTPYGTPKLVCIDAKTGKVVHPYYAIDLDKAVEKVLSYLPIIMDEQVSGDTSLDEEIFRVQNDVVNTQHQIERLVQLAAEGIDTPSVGLKLRSLEKDQKELLATLASLEELASVASPASIRRRRDGLLSVLGSTDDPQLLNVKLRQVLKGVVFNKDGGIKDWQFIGSPATSLEEGQALVEGLVSAKRKTAMI
jgi:DNA invertase Pin-like site-specific DNA recombinase